MYSCITLTFNSNHHILCSSHTPTTQVLMVPGVSFIPGGSESPYVRAAFSVATPENIDIAMQRLASVLDDANASL